jgi:hypothetical protein
VERSCKFGIEPSGSIKCWESIEGLSSGVQLQRVSVFCDMILQNIAELLPDYAV